ncbi:hypothetical protein KIW84_031961 [Lathyrus oleraceus]|uniref:Uncharacterized protein n=1 Tax=Pisum sativum TaxID=3888 RepID=A0A9D4XS42_PEA|nr:hypothetical protein KIW84_031961 [Pisum sativum]
MVNKNDEDKKKSKGKELQRDHDFKGKGIQEHESKISSAVKCGGENSAVAVRIQLSGYYLSYEVVGFRQVPMTRFLYNVCGSRKVDGGVGFEAKRD